MKEALLDFLSIPILCLSFITLPSLHTSLTCDWGVSNDQTTGNVWVTHEEMESLAATPPTVSVPWLARHRWLLASLVTVEACSKLPSGRPDLTRDLHILVCDMLFWLIAPVLIQNVASHNFWLLGDSQGNLEQAPTLSASLWFFCLHSWY